MEGPELELNQSLALSQSKGVVVCRVQAKTPRRQSPFYSKKYIRGITGKVYHCFCLMQVSESCDAPACWTDFGEWGQCSVSCGGNGTQTRSKSCIAPSNGGLACPDSDVEEVIISN